MLPLAFLFLLGVSLLPLTILVVRRARQHGLRPSPGLILALILPTLPFFVAANDYPRGENVLLFAFLALVGLLVGLWVREFTGLMAIGDDAFPGRHDKLIWAAVMILLPPIGPLCFALFRRSCWPAAKPVAHDAVSDLA